MDQETFNVQQPAGSTQASGASIQDMPAPSSDIPETPSPSAPNQTQNSAGPEIDAPHKSRKAVKIIVILVVAVSAIGAVLGFGRSLFFKGELLNRPVAELAEGSGQTETAAAARCRARGYFWITSGSKSKCINPANIGEENMCTQFQGYWNKENQTCSAAQPAAPQVIPAPECTAEQYKCDSWGACVNGTETCLVFSIGAGVTCTPPGTPSTITRQCTVIETVIEGEKEGEMEAGIQQGTEAEAPAGIEGEGEVISGGENKGEIVLPPSAGDVRAAEREQPQAGDETGTEGEMAAEIEREIGAGTTGTEGEGEGEEVASGTEEEEAEVAAGVEGEVVTAREQCDLLTAAPDDEGSRFNETNNTCRVGMTVYSCAASGCTVNSQLTREACEDLGNVYRENDGTCVTEAQVALERDAQNYRDMIRSLQAQLVASQTVGASQTDIADLQEQIADLTETLNVALEQLGEEPEAVPAVVAATETAATATGTSISGASRGGRTPVTCPSGFTYDASENACVVETVAVAIAERSMIRQRSSSAAEVSAIPAVSGAAASIGETISSQAAAQTGVVAGTASRATPRAISQAPLHGSYIQGQAGPAMLVYPAFLGAANLYWFLRKRRKQK